MLYRIIQEQLNNIIKYAKATIVTIRIFEDGGCINLSIKDDGVSFNPKVKGEGIGLKNMRNRSELENGSFTIIAAEGLGCEIRVSLPLDSRE